MTAGPPASSRFPLLLRMHPVSGFSGWQILEEAEHGLALSKPDVTLCHDHVRPPPTAQSPTMGNGAALCRKDIAVQALKTSTRCHRAKLSLYAADVIPTSVMFMEIHPRMSPLIEVWVGITSLLRVTKWIFTVYPKLKSQSLARRICCDLTTKQLRYATDEFKDSTLILIWTAAEINQ